MVAYCDMIAYAHQTTSTPMMLASPTTSAVWLRNVDSYCDNDHKRFTFIFDSTLLFTLSSIAHTTLSFAPRANVDGVSAWWTMISIGNIIGTK